MQSMVFISDVVTSKRTEGQLVVGSPSDIVWTALFNTSTPFGESGEIINSRGN